MCSSSVPEIRASKHITGAIDALVESRNKSPDISNAIKYLKIAREHVSRELSSMYQRMKESEDHSEYLKYKREIMEMDEQSAAREAAKEDD